MNPFRDLLNGAQAPNSRDIPIEFNPIAPMSEGAQQQSQGNDMVLSELQRLKERTLAFEEMLKGRVNQPQMQMPNVAPNKNAALLGGLAALIGALTGDKSAVPAFGQFAGGLQQNAQAKEQKLLQEQQMKMQAQAQKDKALGDLLGFQLEDAQNAYSRANAADVANRKAAADAAEREADNALKERLATIAAGSRETVAKTQAEASVQRARIAATPKAQMLFDSMIARGVPEDKALDIAFQVSLYEAKVDKLKSGAEKDRAWGPVMEKTLAQRKELFKEDQSRKSNEFAQLLPFKARALDIQQYKAENPASSRAPKSPQKAAAEMFPAYKGLVTRYKSLLTEFNTKKAAYEKDIFIQQNNALKGPGWEPTPIDQAWSKKYAEDYYAIKKIRDDLATKITKLEADATKQISVPITGGGASRPFPRGVSQWEKEIQAAAQRHGVDPELIKAVMLQESGGNAGARSPVGAIGLMQLMPGTARGLGVNPNDPAQNIEGGVRYLAQQLKRAGGSVPHALAAYNAGPGRVFKKGGMVIPKITETQRYVSAITSRYKAR